MKTQIETFDTNQFFEIDSCGPEKSMQEHSREDYASQALGIWSTGQSPFHENMVDICEDTINLKEEYQWLTCYIWLPEEYDISDINPDTIHLNDSIEVSCFQIKEELQLLIAKFSWSQVAEMLKSGPFEFIVSGKLFNGTPFDSCDMVTVIDEVNKE